MNLAKIEAEVLLEGRELTRRLLQERLQSEADKIGFLCPQFGLLLKRTRIHTFNLITVAGVVTVRAPYGYSTLAERWICPAREHWALASHQRLSPEFEKRLVHGATEMGSYEKAADLSTLWGSPISDDAIHGLVQRMGARVPLLNELPVAPAQPSEPVFSLVIMIDGWMVRERGPQWGVPPETSTAQKRVAWHEVKSAVIYRLEHRAENASGRGLLIEKYVVACAPETDPLKFGEEVQKEASRRGLARAKEILVLADGAVWIWCLIKDRFPTATARLDFYHAGEHLWDLAHHLHPGNSDAAKRWVLPLLHELRHDPQHRVIETLEQLLVPSVTENQPSDEVLEAKVEYFRNHRAHMDYANLAKRGAPIGSGSIESVCGQFQDRLKRRGQFWSRSGLRNLLALDVAVKNRSHTHLWN